MRDPIQPSETMTARETFPWGRGQERTNAGLPLAAAEKENEPPRGMRAQRPQRVANPPRRAHEALENNTLIRINSQKSQQMEIGSGVDS